MTHHTIPGSQIDPSSALPSKTIDQHQENHDVENHKGCVGGIPVPAQEPATGGDGRGVVEQPVVKPSIVDEVLSVFAASGFEVRTDNPQFAIVGTIDAAGVLVDSFLEAFAQGPTAIERRRELQTVPLPRDAECALEHAALVLSQVGEAAAHDQVVDVIRQHLPGAPRALDVTRMALDWYDHHLAEHEINRDNFHLFALKLAEEVELASRCRAQGGDTKRVDALMVKWDDDGATRGSAFIELRNLARELERAATTQASTAQAERVPTEIAQIGKLIATQDNRCTEAPIFVIEQKTPIISDADYNDCRVEWRETENGDYALATQERAARLEALFRDGRETPGWRRYEVTDVWTFVTACFTEQACGDYLARNGHNLRETRVYAYGSYRNEEFRTIRNWLMGQAATSSTDAQAAAEVRDAVLIEADLAIRGVLWNIENGDGLRDEVYGAQRCRDAIRALRTGDSSEQADGGEHG